MDVQVRAALAEKQKENLELKVEIARLQNIIDSTHQIADETKMIA
jgi:hypothetical protein